MKHLVIGQRLKTPYFSAFHWSPRGSLVSTGQHIVATRVVHLSKSTETSLITESDQSGPNHSYCSYPRPAQPGPNRTRLCGPCIAVIAGWQQYFVIEKRKGVDELMSYKPIRICIVCVYSSLKQKTLFL